MKDDKRTGNSTFAKVICILMIGGGLLFTGLSVISIIVSTAVTIGMVMPMGLGLLMIAYAAIRLKKNGPVFSKRWLRMVITLVLIVGLLGAAFLETLMNMAAYKEQPEEDAGFVIGCQII